MNTLRFSCFDTPADRLLATYKYPILAVGSSDVALVDTWANTQAYSNICQKKNNGTNRGGVIGTAFVARDMMGIVDALNEDGLLRYWGKLCLARTLKLSVHLLTDVPYVRFLLRLAPRRNCCGHVS